MDVNIISRAKRSSDRTVPSTYIASEKDCIYSICKYFYGNLKQIDTLKKLNNMREIEPIAEGTVILLA